MQRGRKQGLWVGRRVPEVDEQGVPILYSRYSSIEEVMQGSSVSPAAQQGKRRQEPNGLGNDESAVAKKQSKRSQTEEDDEPGQQQQQAELEQDEEQLAVGKKQAKKEKKKKKQQQHEQQQHEQQQQQQQQQQDEADAAAEDEDNTGKEQQQRNAGNAEEAHQIRNVLGFQGTNARAAPSFTFSFDAQVAAQVEAETEAKLARLHAIDSADKDGYMPRRVFVGGMPYSYTREQIEEYWSWCGEIESLDMLTFPDSGRFRGIAFITFTTQEGYEAALACDGEMVDGQTLKVDKCKAAAAAPRRGGSIAAAAAAVPPPAATKPAEQETPSKVVPSGGNRGGAAGSSGRPGKTPGYNVAYVGNIAFEVTPEELKEVFADCGVKLVRLHTDQKTGRSKGYAHVHFEDDAGLDRAMSLDGHVLQGRGIRVSYGQPKK